LLHKILAEDSSAGMSIRSTAWLTPSTSVFTAGSSRFADLFQKGDDITVLTGPAQKRSCRVKRVLRKKYTGPMIRLKTKTHTLEVPSDQLLFTDINSGTGPFLTVLAQFEESNWAILMIKDFKNLMKTGCLRAYILFVDKLHQEALNKMVFTAVNFGIPSYDFTAGAAKKQPWPPEWIKNVFIGVNTGERAENLLKKRVINSSFPHFSNFKQLDKKPLNIIMFSDETLSDDKENPSQWNHRIHLEQKLSGDNERSPFAPGLEIPGLRLPGNDPRAWEMWNIDITKENYSELLMFARTLRALDSVVIIEKARLYRKHRPFVRFPAGNLNTLMSLPVIDEKYNPKECAITSVEIYEYKGDLIKLVPDEGHTLIASNIAIPIDPEKT
jgi:hypothetical protein